MTTELTILPNQIKKIHVLLPEHIKSDPAEKAAFVAQFTGDPTRTSTKQLTRSQADAMINYLDESSDRMRKKILSICHDIGWETDEGKIDWDRLNAWLKKYGHKHKSNLNYYSKKELTVLVTQFEKLQQSEYEKVG